MSNEDKIDNRSQSQYEFRESEGKSNLILKFRKVFIFPISFGILINIILTIGFFVNFSINLNNNKYITSILELSEKDSNKPIIENVANIIYKKFQPTIYTLNSLKKYLRQITNEEFLDLKDNSFNKKI